MSGAQQTEEMRKLADWLKKSRKARGLTMQALAECLEKPSSFVAKVEQCDRRLDVVEYVSYCSALEASAFEGLGVFDAKLRAQLKKQNA